MADEKGIVIPPPHELPRETPYANATFTFANNGLDITILFLRLPLMVDAAAVERMTKGELHSSVVASVTMPIRTARDMAEHMVKSIKELEEVLATANKAKP